MSLCLGAREVCFDFPGTRAVDQVSVAVQSEEILAVVGANGSGKTTLLSLLCGLRRPASGSLYDDSGDILFRSPSDALRLRITLVPQEPQLADTLSCWENILLGRRAPYGVTLSRRARLRARRAVKEALPHIDPGEQAARLRKADRAVLALLVALERQPRLLALDEPTAVLGERSVEVVASAIERVRSAGGAVVLVSHRLRDIMELATRVVVLVDGRVTHQSPVGEISVTELVERLAHGRSSNPSGVSSASVGLREPTADNGAVLTVRELQGADGLRVDHLQVRPGDIVGLAGLGGSGRSRLLRVLSGAQPYSSGDIEFRGRALRGGVRGARRAGIAYVPEDRAMDGIFPTLTVARNLAMGELVGSRPLWTRSSRTRESRLAKTLIARFEIRAPHTYAPITALSGGNMQRVLLGRVLAGQPTLLLADEPTQGVDVAGRVAIHGILKDFADRGGAVLLVTSDFEELLSLSNRIVLMRDRKTLGELAPSQTDYRELVSLATGAVDFGDFEPITDEQI